MKIKLSKSQWDFIGKQANWTRTKWEGSTGAENAKIIFDKNFLEKVRRTIFVILNRNKIEPIDLKIISCDKNGINIYFGYKIKDKIEELKRKKLKGPIRETDEIIKWLQKKWKREEAGKENDELKLKRDEVEKKLQELMFFDIEKEIVDWMKENYGVMDSFKVNMNIDFI